MGAYIYIYIKRERERERERERDNTIFKVVSYILYMYTVYIWDNLADGASEHFEMFITVKMSADRMS